MPKIDFGNVGEVEDFAPLPEGKYLCELTDIEESSTQNGDELWKLRFEVIEGEHVGRYIFDNMVFSKAAMRRVKLICSRLGLDVSGEIDLTPDMLIERACYLIVDVDSYKNEEGATKKRNIVRFSGYEHANKADVENEKNPSDDLPF